MPAEPAIDVPKHLFEAYERLAAGPTRPIAGGTDVMVAITGELGPVPERMLDLSRVDALRGIHLEPNGLVLGARTTYTEIRRSALCREHLPALVEAAATIGAAQIQNRGTLGGNVANASPAGDTLPVLLAADAMILVGGQRGEREVAAKDFFIAYRRTALAPDELILQVRFPIPPGREMRFRKVGTRRAQAISKVVIAVAWHDFGSQGWHDVRVALGSVAATPVRAPKTERVLEGAQPTPETVDLAAETLAAELQPIDDVRSTADYRRTVSARILHRLLRDAGGW
ncbi:MAG TPA: xanthine dehydrogenase family protein subunit M [Candidatus Limnocylindrales bacterium]|jgi:carbon-monoxide dehydrogenase medium subunit|nr:xanthine dehydrogenase family protein subunit M [Candidatus Limnocylindrales bacterium]